MKFSGKMWPMIISKVTKKLDFTVSLEDTFLEKTQGEERHWPPSPRSFRVKLGTRKFQFPKYKEFFQSGFFYFSSSESCLLKYKKNMKLESSISVNKRILFISKLRSFISWNIRNFLILELGSAIYWNIRNFLGCNFFIFSHLESSLLKSSISQNIGKTF